MKLSEFNYFLPKDKIAQYPLRERDSSRLMVVHRKYERIEHRVFRDIVEYFQVGDVLVLNDTRVIPARLYGRKLMGGKVEVLLLNELSTNIWEAIVKGLHQGKVMFKAGVTAHVARFNGTAKVKFEGDDIKNYLNKIGVMPLPPYIRRPVSQLDTQHYQTVYAEKKGAIAAPTAGLHFTTELLSRIKEKGVEVKKLTLHVGYGTFKPVSSTEIEKHQMKEEYYEIPEDTANIINHAKSEGRRVIAVGTTVTRALEAAACEENNPPSPPFSKGGMGGFSGVAGKVGNKKNTVRPGSGKASIFIYPGYRFRVIDALITNFHLPESTPLMLTSAFSEPQLLRGAYLEALNSGYRFFSYGDAMLII